MNKTIAVGEFKAKCLKIFEEVHTKQDKIIITKRGEPIAEILPFSGKTGDVREKLKNSILFEGDIVSPIDEPWGETRMKFRVLIEQDEDGMYVAQCPNLPGCVSQGKSRAEALKNIQDAMQGYLESLKKHNDPIPPPIHEELIDIAL